MRILLVSPYHGGSHASWAHGLERHSRHLIELLTLPDRFWKWRMHGGAATLARRFLKDHQHPDVILATDMLDLTTFLALTRSVTADVPAVLYMHENQLTYPLPAEPDTGPMRRQGGERDHHYAFVNFSSMLAADRVAFNSAFHRDAWFEALPRFLRHFPEHNELCSVDELRSRSCVLPVGIEPDDPGAETIDAAAGAVGLEADTHRGEAGPEAPDAPAPPLIIWNQRWEYDKNPALLLRALGEVADRGVGFRLAVCGQAFGKSPAGFDGIEELFGDRLIHLGFADDHNYRRLLRQAALTVSTADHEFFGIAVLEAMAAGAFAILPERLSYPELISGPEVSAEARERCLYRSYEELVETIVWALENRHTATRFGEQLARNARRFDWRRVAPAYDDLFESVSAT